MNSKEILFMEQLKATKYFEICARCVQEIDLRKHNYKEIEDGFFVHYVCPPIRPKYT